MVSRRTKEYLVDIVYHNILTFKTKDTMNLFD